MKNLKTPISYYGGKQLMVNDILPLIPLHVMYTECFIGGAAIYFAKQPSKIEVINDLNKEVVNFYQVLKSDFENLREKVDKTIHSRETHQDTLVVYQNPHLFSELERAYAFWVQTTMTYGSSPGSTFAFSKTKKNATPIKIDNKKHSFLPELQHRLEHTTIECDDAIKVIKRYDTPDAFHYVDPPYYNADMGHYGGYTEAHFINLLDALSKIKGKFLLSSYPSDILSKYIRQNGWNQKLIDKPLSMSKGKRKIESLTSNYPI
jgi:DNA adenine methylase